MSKASDLTTSEFLSFLFKAPWGFGKTIAAASFAVDGPVWIAYWDKKAPVELIHFLKKIGRQDLLRFIEYEVYGATNANEYLNKMIQFAKGRCDYFAVINDSVTRMTSGAVNWSLAYDPGRKDKGVKLSPGFDEYKVETSLVAQALDAMIEIKAHQIWTCHPLPSLKTEGSGSTMRVSKVNNIVTYGSKVAGIIPGSFSEIYQFSKLSDFSNAGKSKYLVSTNAIGDDYAKSNIGLDFDLDITDRLFYEVWKEAVKNMEVKEKPKQLESSNVIIPSNSPWK